MLNPQQNYSKNRFSSEVDAFLQAHHDLQDFLGKFYSLTAEIYGQVDLSFALWQNPLDKSDMHLRITIDSGLESDEEVTEYENRLFDLLEHRNLVWALKYVVISQEWQNS